MREKSTKERFCFLNCTKYTIAHVDNEMMQKYIFLIVLTTQNLKIKNMKYRFTILVHHLKNILFLYVAFLYLENAFSTHTHTHMLPPFRLEKQNKIYICSLNSKILTSNKENI